MAQKPTKTSPAAKKIANDPLMFAALIGVLREEKKPMRADVRRSLVRSRAQNTRDDLEMAGIRFI